MSSPVGVWACLDEATVLHGNEEDPKQLKNRFFLYFTSWPRHRIHSSRFKGHVQAIVDKLNVVQPRFVHCLRPRASTSKDFTALDMGVLKAQVQGQLLAPIVTYSMSSIVRTFRGREGVLFEKLKQKYTSTQVQSADDDTSLESFVLKVQFDGPTVHKMLSNPKMALLLGEPNILQALRELSIDPSVIYLQTTDPVLRLFYTELRAFITPKPHPDRIPYPDMPLDDAVLVPDSVTDGSFKRWPGCSCFIPRRTWRLKIKQLSER
ncbi:hypothetical protein DYB28_001182 [Aphanomyces astaci]|uniref:Uncharacterized protein n=1 Tax=Aphanomyces astaci TaxID=112090 RepID=A0A9X8DQ03_APHAT|nr:hypothetical protein DYB28_001182 [Aphanomyces astaci]